MATAVAAAKTARAAANGGNSSFSPFPGGGFTRLRWLPPGPAARDGRAAILEERRPRLPATCAPIGGRGSRRRLAKVSTAPARGGAETGVWRPPRRRRRRPCGSAPGPTRGRGGWSEAPAPGQPGSRRARLWEPLLLRRTPGSAGPGVEVERDRRRPSLGRRALRSSRTGRQTSRRKAASSHCPGRRPKSPREARLPPGSEAQMGSKTAARAVALLNLDRNFPCPHGPRRAVCRGARRVVEVIRAYRLIIFPRLPAPGTAAH